MRKAALTSSLLKRVRRGCFGTKALMFRSIFLAAWLLTLSYVTTNVQAEESRVWVQSQSITIESPKNNVTYVDTMPLVFAVVPLAYPGPYPLNYGENSVWGGGASYSLDGQANITVSGSINLTGLGNGTHTIRLFATWTYFNDFYMGGTGPQPFGVTYSPIVNFTFVNTIPAVSNLSVENRTYYTKNMALSFTVTEPVASASYSQDCQSNVTIPGNTTITGLSLGAHNLTVYATDEVGNCGASETIHFSIEDEPQQVPFPFVYVIVAAAVVALASAILRVYFKKAHPWQNRLVKKL